MTAGELRMGQREDDASFNDFLFLLHSLNGVPYCRIDHPSVDFIERSVASMEIFGPIEPLDRPQSEAASL